jgi:hypothetical protein
MFNIKRPLGMKTIEVSDEVHDQLVQLAGRLFSPSEVIQRLVQMAAAERGEERGIALREPSAGNFRTRGPRERGISVMVEGHRIDAVSVRDLFEKILKWLVDRGPIERVEPALPLRTSNQRFLIARKPVHPHGNDFVVPVGYKGYSMEAHKNYENAMSGLKQLARVGGFSIQQI